MAVDFAKPSVIETLHLVDDFIYTDARPSVCAGSKNNLLRLGSLSEAILSVRSALHVPSIICVDFDTDKSKTIVSIGIQINNLTVVVPRVVPVQEIAMNLNALSFYAPIIMWNPHQDFVIMSK
jgi:hypothetical protein